MGWNEKPNGGGWPNSELLSTSPGTDTIKWEIRNTAEDGSGGRDSEMLVFGGNFIFCIPWNETLLAFQLGFLHCIALLFGLRGSDVSSITFRWDRIECHSGDWRGGVSVAASHRGFTLSDSEPPICWNLISLNVRLIANDHSRELLFCHPHLLTHTHTHMLLFLFLFCFFCFFFVLLSI